MTDVAQDTDWENQLRGVVEFLAGSEDFDNRWCFRPIQNDPDPIAKIAELTKNNRYVRRGHTVLLFRRADIIKVNRHPSVLGHGGSKHGGTLGAEGGFSIPQETDGDEHEKWRALLDPLFAPHAVKLLSDQIRAFANGHLDRLVQEPEGDVTEEFCLPLPSQVFLTFLGAPQEDLPFYLKFHRGIMRPAGDTDEEALETVRRTGAEMIDYIYRLMETRRSEPPREDLLSKLLVAEVDGKPITDQQTNAIIYAMLLGGLDTIASTLTLMLAWLAKHPADRQRLVDDPELIPGFVEELLRRESPVVTNQRYPQEDIDLGDGLVVRKGDKVHCFRAGANMDGDAFPDPLYVDIDHPRRTHLSFDSGPHRCLGLHLARLELRIALEEFLRRIPQFSVKPGTEVEYYLGAVRRADHVPLLLS